MCPVRSDRLRRRRLRIATHGWLCPLVALLLAGLFASGCSSGCSQEMDHGGTSPDGSGGSNDAAVGGDGGPLPLCPDAGPPPDASPYDASPYDAGMVDAGMVDAGPTPDAGPPTCRHPWDAGPM